MSNNDDITRKLLNKGISTSTNPANPLQHLEVQNKSLLGYKGVEVQTFTFEGDKGWARIPKFIWEEAARLARINEMNLSLHAPENDFQLSSIIGERFTDSVKRDMAYKVSAVLETASIMGNIYGNSLHVNMHAGDMESAVYDKGFEEMVKKHIREDPKKLEEIKKELLLKGYISAEEYKNIDSVDKLPSWLFAKIVHSYASILLEPEKAMGRKEGVGEVLYSHVGIVSKDGNIIKELDLTNKNIWNNIVEAYTKEASEIVRPFNRGYIKHEVANILLQIQEDLRENNIENLKEHLFYLSSYIEKVKNSLEEYEKLKNVIKYYLDKYKEKLEHYKNSDILDDKIKKEISNKIEEIYNYERKMFDRSVDKSIKDLLEKIEKEIKEIREGNIDNNKIKDLSKSIGNLFGINTENIQEGPGLIDNLARNIVAIGEKSKNLNIPVLYPADVLARENAREIVKNAIIDMLNRIASREPQILQNLDKVFPTIIIEQSYAGTIASRPELLIGYMEEVKKGIKEALEELEKRKEFFNIINKIKKEYGSIEEFVDKHVGINWDVGHAKMYEKFGYTKEDILKWLDNFNNYKKYLKHIHVHETQWGSDTHLPLGMGWDDVVMEELNKLKDILENKETIVVHEPGGFYSTGLSQLEGLYEYLFSPYSLRNLYYGSLGVNTGYPNFYTISGPYQFVYQNINQQPIVPYSVFTYSLFSNLPEYKGPKQTFSGRSID